jgi:hypothetical protein
MRLCSRPVFVPPLEHRPKSFRAHWLVALLRQGPHHAHRTAKGRRARSKRRAALRRRAPTHMGESRRHPPAMRDRYSQRSVVARCTHGTTRPPATATCWPCRCAADRTARATTRSAKGRSCCCSLRTHRACATSHPRSPRFGSVGPVRSPFRLFTEPRPSGHGRPNWPCS